MRTITDHIVSGDSVNHQVSITVIDEPGAGGANHAYHIDWPTADGGMNDLLPNCLTARFQNGPIKEFGVNGITQEALLAIVIDRLKSFQNGPFACHDNGTALNHCETALNVLQNRTRARIARGVEGTHQR